MSKCPTPSDLAVSIVRRALALRQDRPDLSALQALDLAMRGRRGTSPDFGAAKESLIGHGSPFGAMLAEAFAAPCAHLRGLADTWAGGRHGDSAEARFQRVRDAFALRYRLHDRLGLNA